jgi:glycosyltransferase involved in cell wall biosynthesis
MTDYLVVIPTRNRYPLALRAVRSVLAQSVPPTEIVVVNDASTDPRYEWLDEIVNDSRLTMITLPKSSQEVTGSGFAVGYVRNVALAHARHIGFEGWLAFLDDDDEWMPEKMATQFATARRYDDVRVFCSNAYNRSPAGLICGYHHGDHGRKLNGCHDVTQALREINPVICSTAIIDAATARKVGQQAPSGYSEDWDYWRRAAILSPVFRVDEPLAYYTVGNQKEYEL